MKDLMKKVKKITKEEWIRMGGCLLIGILIMLLFYPDRIAQLKNGEEVAIKLDNDNITADTMYNKLKEKYAIYELLDIIDSKILYSKYELTDEDNETLKDKADSYIKYYENTYQMTEEQFLEKNNFDSYDDFKTYLELDYLRQKYYDEYLTSKISDDEINDYYDKSVYAPFNVEHILVKISDDVTDDDAKEKATEILDKLKDGEDWDDLKDEYEDDITSEAFQVDFDSNLEKEFKTAAEKLSDDSYTKSLVKTSYGYHIIYRKDTLDKPELNDVKSRILTVLKSNYVSENKNVYEKSLINLREESGLDIKDTGLKKVYKNYTKDYE